VPLRTLTLGLVLLAATCALGSCAYSVRTSSLPPHLKTVAIPVFDNATTQYRLEQEITDAVIDRFVRNNQLRVVDERSANAVIQGKVMIYRNNVFGFSEQTKAQEYRVTITVSVVFKDLIKNRELWTDENLTKSSNYYVQDVPGQTAKTEIDGRKEAVEKIADEILARTVQGW
jgi:outer membrane lipopolysaccharide assembly protein LptE/RlpB